MISVRSITEVYGGRRLFFIRSNEPIHTYVGFGVIDRGTNVIQVRPTTLCPLNCIFCSVDAGPFSRNRVCEFYVDLNNVVKAFDEVARFKQVGVEALIDTIGEPFTYPHVLELIRRLREKTFVKSIALETHGAHLNDKVVEKLEEAGLNRVNLSIETFNVDKAKFIQGVSWYNPLKVKEYAEKIVKDTGIDLHVTPVWLPGLNDEDIVEIISWAYRIGAGKKWPPATIQKFVIHRYGRRPRIVKHVDWNTFWKWIKDFEAKYGLTVTWNMKEWGMFKTRRFPCPYRVGDVILTKVFSRGVFKGEFLAETLDKNVLVVVKSRVKIGKYYLVKVNDDKDCLIKCSVVEEVEPSIIHKHI